MTNNALGKNCRWMIKFPYKTNQTYMPIANDISKVLTRLKNISKEYYGAIPYVFMQRRLINRMERKVVCHDKKPIYFAHIEKTSRDRKKINIPDDHFKEFAILAIATVQQSCPSLLCDGLLRVDMMYCDILKCLFVNELESFEAFFTGDGETETNEFLMRYHYKKIACSVDDLKSK